MNQNQTFTPREARAKIRFDQGWNLTPAGTSHPLRYWSHVHFEDDPKWGQELWTLFVELDSEPAPLQKDFTARIFFMAPTAPHVFLRIGQKFNLCVGPMVKAHGVITEVTI